MKSIRLTGKHGWVVGTLLTISLILLFSLSWAGSTVYVMSGGNSTADQAVLNALIARGHTPVIGVQSYLWDGTQVNLNQFEAVVLLNNYNWNQPGMPANGQSALLNYVAGGGGLVTGEWLIWNMDSAGKHKDLEPMIPADEGTFNAGTSTTYTQVTEESIINNGLPPSFSFNLNNINSTESYLDSKDGATVFYSSSNTGHKGVIGWNYGLGAVISFSTLISQTELANANYAKLFVNAVEWVAAPHPFSISGTVTGSVNQGVTITLSGTASKTITTDTSGNYGFAGLINGIYTVTPSKTGYTFSPLNRSVTINNADVSGQNFTASTPCIAWSDVIEKYNIYVAGQAVWSDVIECYNQYASK